MSTNSVTASHARANLYQLLRQSAMGEEITISLRGSSPVIMLSLEDYEALKETTEILTTPGVLEEIRQGEREADKRQGVPLDELKDL